MLPFKKKQKTNVKFICNSLTISLVILLVSTVLWLQPRWLLNLVPWVAPGAVYFFETDRSVIALTIDDGPEAETTAHILETLAQHGAKATFFLISNKVQGNEFLVSRLVREGHEIGNHLTEERRSIFLSPEAFERSLREADRVLSKFADVTWLRPGGGFYTAQMIQTARRYRYHVALGSIFPYDTHVASPWFAAQQIVWNARPGAIIILHDGNARGKRAAKTLGQILPRLKRKGYQVVTLSTLFELSEKDAKARAINSISKT